MTRPLYFVILLLLSLQIQAVHLSKDGTGQVLIFPYYTVNGGYDTLITLVNTTDEAKALRVRFREAANSREVFAFNVYLGANDEWTGGVIASEDAMNQIISFDQSCAFPNMSIGSNTKFYDDKFTGDFSDDYTGLPHRMNEGFLEVFEMGVMTGDSANAATMTEDTAANCAVFENAWNDDGYWTENAGTDMLPPTGGITGSVTLINVTRGMAISQEPTAFENFSDNILNYNIEHDSPSLADSSVNAQIEQDGVLLDTQWPTGYQAITALLMKKSISNEFVTTDGIGAETDWILTMPTRQFHIDSRYSEGSTPVAPFDEDNFSCELYAYNYFDRESQPPYPKVPGPIGVPPPANIPPPPVLCHSANNIAFFDNEFDTSLTLGIFDSNFPAQNNDGIRDTTEVAIQTISDFNGNHSYFSTGWMNLKFEQTSVLVDNNENITFEGMPVIGFAVQTYVNASSIQENKNYAGIFEHKFTSQITQQAESEEVKPMSIAQDNKGQVLLFPYYTVKNDLNTLISVVNTTDDVKALKIRFLEGKNSRDVLTFNIYLSAYDVWTAGLVPTSSTLDGHLDEPSVKLITFDNSCTVPELISGQEFLPYGYTGFVADGLGESMDRVQEGSIEIIEMGTLRSSDAMAATMNSIGEPNNCSLLANHWTPPVGNWIQNPNNNLAAPDGLGGLYGSVSLIDIDRGVDMTYEATAIINFTTDINHTSINDLSPNLSSGNNSKTSIQTEEHGIVSTTWDSPLNAVSALFMNTEISNVYVVEPEINAQTDWVNFYPSRRFYTDALHFDIAIDQTPFTPVSYTHLTLPTICSV